MQVQQSPEEWIRQFLCKNIKARNWIWEEHIRRACALGLDAGLQRAEPLPGQRYKRRGLIGLGYDHTGHGETPEASKSALVIVEVIGNWLTFPYVKLWEPRETDAKAAVIKGGAKIVPAAEIDRKGFVAVEKPVWDKFATTPELKALVQEIVDTK